MDTTYKGRGFEIVPNSTYSQIESFIARYQNLCCINIKIVGLALFLPVRNHILHVQLTNIKYRSPRSHDTD